MRQRLNANAQGTFSMTLLAATTLVALASAANVAFVVLLADRFGSERRDASLRGAVPTAA